MAGVARRGRAERGAGTGRVSAAKGARVRGPVRRVPAWAPDLRLHQPAIPAGPGVEEGILRGIYRFRQAEAAGTAPQIQLLASGTAIHWALSAQELLLSQ